MTQIIEITQIAIISVACILAIGIVLWTMYKVLNDK